MDALDQYKAKVEEGADVFTPKEKQKLDFFYGVLKGQDPEFNRRTLHGAHIAIGNILYDTTHLQELTLPEREKKLQLLRGIEDAVDTL